MILCSCKQNLIDDRVYQMLQTCVKNLSVDELKNFLKFVTGYQYLAIMVIPFLPQHVYLN